MPVAQRFAALSAAALTLLASFRAFQEAADLSLSGIDISDGNVLMALITGLGLPVVLESIYGRHPAGATPQAQSVTRAALDAGLRLAGSTLTSALALVFMLVFAGNAGAACLVLGMAMWGVVAAAAMAASAVEAGLPTWRSMPSALVTATLAPLALPWRDTLSDVTRAQKLLMVNSLTAAGLVWILLAALQRRQSAPAETPPDAEASSD
ncbi:MAG: hypothetical protein EB084_16295 [Proteobacteria bacterium]|nr:hypothetical protein [Pseudomonadota bacterium]